MQGLVKVSQFFGKTFVLWVLVAAGTCFLFARSISMDWSIYIDFTWNHHVWNGDDPYTERLW